MAVSNRPDRKIGNRKIGESPKTGETGMGQYKRVFPFAFAGLAKGGFGGDHGGTRLPRRCHICAAKYSVYRGDPMWLRECRLLYNAPV